MSKACAVLLLCVAMVVVSRAQVLTTLVNFDDANGAFPSFIGQATNGRLLGTTFGSSQTYCGTVFSMTPVGVFNTVLTFTCNPSYPDGNEPDGFIQATDGNFYGVTFFGGSNEEGSVIKLTPTRVLTTLANFDGSSGCGPVGSLAEGRDGNFYGAATGCGNQYGYGTVFKITPSGTLTTLYEFDFTHGALPYAGLILANDGNFYGTTYSGGAYGVGTVYKITPQGTFTLLYSFGEHTYDPFSPVTALCQGSDGNFYGTTPSGGNSIIYGAIFKLTPQGVFTTLYSFSGTDGYSPTSSLVQATDGNLYGTTGYYTGGDGTIFKVTPTGTLTTLQTFNGSNGSDPFGLIQDTNGTFYGLTQLGGSSNKGTVFSFNNGLHPFVSFLPPLSSGTVGNIIQILGQGFTGTTAVSFNGTSATFTERSDTYLTATVPSGAASGFVSVTTPTGTLKSNKPFRVLP